MFSGLPKLYGRGFLVGFLLPSAMFCLYIQYIGLIALDLSGINNSFESLKLTPFIVSVLIISVLLIALNRNIIRILEGYGGLNPLALLKPIQILIWNWKIDPVLKEAERIASASNNNSEDTPRIKNFSRKLHKAVEFYPSRREALLATKFGNSMRAFEIYSRVVYGLDAIPSWPRISFFLSKEIKEQIQDGRSIIDFSANLFFLSIIALSAFAFKNYGHLSDPNIGIIAAPPLACAIYAWINLPSAARQWGVSVKSAIDVSRSKLAKELGLTIPVSAEEEQRMWYNVTNYMIYRSEAHYLALDRFRRKPKREVSKPRTR